MSTSDTFDDVIYLVGDDDNDAELIVLSEQGDPGIQGPPGAASGLSRIAGTILSGHRVVMTLEDGTVGYASNDDPVAVNAALFMTTTAANDGDEVFVTALGEVIEPSWAWDMALPIFLGANGVLTQIAPVAPAAVFILQVAAPVSSTSLLFNPREPIRLAP